MCSDDIITLSTCSWFGGSCTGGMDTFFYLYDSKGFAMASNDDFCSGCSQVSFQQETKTCQLYYLEQGCYQGVECAATTAVVGAMTMNSLPPLNRSIDATLSDQQLLLEFQAISSVDLGWNVSD